MLRYRQRIRGRYIHRPRISYFGVAEPLLKFPQRDDLTVAFFLFFSGSLAPRIKLLVGDASGLDPREALFVLLAVRLENRVVGLFFSSTAGTRRSRGSAVRRILPGARSTPRSRDRRNPRPARIQKTSQPASLSLKTVLQTPLDPKKSPEAALCPSPFGSCNCSSAYIKGEGKCASQPVRRAPPSRLYTLRGRGSQQSVPNSR